MWKENKKYNKRIDRIISERYQSNDRRAKAPEINIKQSLIRIIGKKAKKYIDDNKNSYNKDDYLVPWSYDQTIKIDRFDARSFLDSFSIPKSAPFELTNSINDENSDKRNKLNQLCNFERFQTLIQLKATKIPEDRYIKKLAKTHGTFEQLGAEDSHIKKYNPKVAAAADSCSIPSAAIEYRYEDSHIVAAATEDDNIHSPESVNSHHINNSIIDIPIDVNLLSDEKKKEIDLLAGKFGIHSMSFTELLMKDIERKKLSKEIYEDDVTIWNNVKNKEDVGYLREKQKFNQRLITQYYDEDVELEMEKPKSILQEEINKTLKEYQQQLYHNKKETASGSDSSEGEVTHAVEHLEYISEFDSNKNTTNDPSKRKRKSRFDQLPLPPPIIPPMEVVSTSKNTPKKVDDKTTTKKSTITTTTKIDKKLTPRELLKLRTQALIEKQLKSDQSKR